jgi:PTS system nitrogen regulatory IIA component
MDLKSFLSPEDVLIDVNVPDKTHLLQKLADRAASTLKLPADRIFRALSTREGLGSTGIGSGVAVPHARVEGVENPFGTLARLNRPIEFNSIDNKPVDLVFLLLLPTTPAGEQLNALASVARRLRNFECVRSLRSAVACSDLFYAFIAAAETC